MTATRSVRAGWAALLIASAQLIPGAASAGAAGINLGWNDCPGGGTYTSQRNFACDTNEGTNTLVVSFVAPPGVLAMNANEIVIDMLTSGAVLAPWWSLRVSAPHGCRTQALRHSEDFTAGPFTCFDYWQGGAVGGTSMDPPIGNRARIKAVDALPAGSPLITSVPAGTEVYSIKLDIRNTQTVGDGACGGCTDEACLVLQQVRLDQPVGIGPITLTNPAISQFVTWQGWTTPWPHCPDATPAKPRTWGSVKALYR